MTSGPASSSSPLAEIPPTPRTTREDPEGTLGDGRTAPLKATPRPYKLLKYFKY